MLGRRSKGFPDDFPAALFVLQSETVRLTPYEGFPNLISAKALDVRRYGKLS